MGRRDNDNLVGLISDDAKTEASDFLKAILFFFALGCILIGLRVLWDSNLDDVKLVMLGIFCNSLAMVILVTMFYLGWFAASKDTKTEPQVTAAEPSWRVARTRTGSPRKRVEQVMFGQARSQQWNGEPSLWDAPDRKEIFGMSLQAILLLITPLAGATLGAILVYAYPDFPWWGILVLVICLILVFLQIKYISLDDLPIWTGFLVIGIVILGVIDHYYDEQEAGALFFIMVFMVMMYGFIGFVGVMKWIGIAGEYIKERW